jgi:ABC-type lipoprotein release transport system permease subunit
MFKKILNILKIIPTILNPRNWLKVVKTIYQFVGFFILLVLFIVVKFSGIFVKIPIIGKIFTILFSGIGKILGGLYQAVIEKIETTRTTEVKRSYLIRLGYQNLMAKKTRSLITIFGMSVGVGIIVLLLSLGYGIERLIIGKVASLDELKMIDVSIGENTSVHLNNNLIKKINKMVGVAKSIPLISIVGKVTYNKAQTDVLVYAVSKDYLDMSKVKLTKGKLFAQGNDYTTPEVFALNTPGVFANNTTTPGVLGISTEIPLGIYNEKITNKETNFNILPDEKAVVWENCSITSGIKGYLPRYEGGYRGYEYWGSEYYPFDKSGRVAEDKSRNIYLGKWIKAKVPIYEIDENDNLKPKLDNTGKQVWDNGCIQEKNILFEGKLIAKLNDYGEVTWENSDNNTPTTPGMFGQVLGVSSDDVLAASDSATSDTTDTTATDSADVNAFSAVNVSTNSAGIEFVELAASDSAKKTTQPALTFAKPPSGTAIISTGMMNLLNISSNKAIGTKFKVSFIIVKSLKPDVEGKAMTTDTEYTISGVIDDADASYFYIPLSDMAKLGVDNFSQLKVTIKKQDDLGKIRKQIETLGFRTNSTADTVNQIESLFANLRIILGLLGMVALAVASLGMFNTLTVSLLERTREIGGMKTMGMISSEVQDLFLSEAMIMGLSGGIGGLVLGFVIGKLLSLLVSIIAITNGQGYLELTYVPGFLIIFILISSFVVGLVTGLYPAQRAKKISALNALRYE